MTSDGQSSDKPVTTNKNEKNYKNEKNNKTSSSQPRKKRVYDTDSIYYILAEELFKQICQNQEIKKPNLQSWADDIRKMIEIDKRMRREQVRSRMILQIHDELIFDVPEDEVEQMMRIVKEGMQNVVKLKVPLVANASIGRTWYEAK